MRSRLILSAVSVLGAASGLVLTSKAKGQPAHMWEIGPILGGRNVSIGMPATLTPAGRLSYFDFPHPNADAGHVHYVTTRTGPLVGKSKIVMRYRMDAPPGVRIVARQNPRTPATLALYFQRHGDNWSGRGPFEYYRWYATVANRIPLTPGEHQVSLSLEGRNWKSVMSATGLDVPTQFREALQNTKLVGFVLGGAGGAGHGVYATGPVRFTLISFHVM